MKNTLIAAAFAAALPASAAFAQDNGQDQADISCKQIAPTVEFCAVNGTQGQSYISPQGEQVFVIPGHVRIQENDGSVSVMNECVWIENPAQQSITVECAQP